jgi:hypothetical protein
LTSDGTEIVRYFGSERRVIVPRDVEVLQKSCFQSINSLEEIIFENGSKLKTIGPSALSECKSLTSIVIPASVERIEKFAFRECGGLEVCLIDENSVLVRIGDEAFHGCISLRSFNIARGVKVIGQNCFRKCVLLHEFKFGSVDSLKTFVGDVTLDEALDNLGLSALSSVFQITVHHSEPDLNFRGWSSITDEDSYLTFTQDLQ